MLTIWGRATSSNVQKVMWAIGELELPHRRIDAGLAFGVVDTPEYARMNPNRLVPTIEDDGFVLWESNAILRYLARRHAGAARPLLPADPRAAADADRWMDWQLSRVAQPATTVFIGLTRTRPEDRDPAAIAAAQRQLADLYAILDAALAERPFLAGDALSMGDIPLGVMIHRWYKLRDQQPALPHLDAWYRRLAERPAYQSAVMSQMP